VCSPKRRQGSRGSACEAAQRPAKGSEQWQQWTEWNGWCAEQRTAAPRRARGSLATERRAPVVHEHQAPACRGSRGCPWLRGLSVQRKAETGQQCRGWAMKQWTGKERQPGRAGSRHVTCAAARTGSPGSRVVRGKGIAWEDRGEFPHAMAAVLSKGQPRPVQRFLAEGVHVLAAEDGQEREGEGWSDAQSPSLRWTGTAAGEWTVRHRHVVSREESRAAAAGACSAPTSNSVFRKAGQQGTGSQRSATLWSDRVVHGSSG
jgi:hypothetical protein